MPRKIPRLKNVDDAVETGERISIRTEAPYYLSHYDIDKLHILKDIIEDEESAYISLDMLVFSEPPKELASEVGSYIKSSIEELLKEGIMKTSGAKKQIYRGILSSLEYARQIASQHPHYIASTEVSVDRWKRGMYTIKHGKILPGMVVFNMALRRDGEAWDENIYSLINTANTYIHTLYREAARHRNAEEYIKHNTAKIIASILDTSSGRPWWTELILTRPDQRLKTFTGGFDFVARRESSDRIRSIQKVYIGEEQIPVEYSLSLDIDDAEYLASYTPDKSANYKLLTNNTLATLRRIGVKDRGKPKISLLVKRFRVGITEFKDRPHLYSDLYKAYIKKQENIDPDSVIHLLRQYLEDHKYYVNSYAIEKLGDNAIRLYLFDEEPGRLVYAYSVSLLLQIESDPYTVKQFEEKIKEEMRRRGVKRRELKPWEPKL